MTYPLVERLILVLEHDPVQANRIAALLNQGGEQYQIVAIADGQQALHFLRRQQNYIDAPRPDLILLDLNLPEVSGYEILAAVKTDPRLRRIPTIVLTFSTEAEDILTAYTLQGNCYVLKSSDLEQLTQIVQRIKEFWLRIVTLPVE